jgi:hypothetical protein
MNNTLADLASMIEDSLSRSGQGGMLAPLSFSDGTEADPGIAFSNQTTTGFYRSVISTISTLRAVVEGTWRLGVNTAGALVNGTFSVSGTSTFTGRVTASAGVAGLLTGDMPASNYVEQTTSTGTFSTSATSATNVTNATVTITTKGNPVMLILTGDNSNFTASGITLVGIGNSWARFQLVRTGTSGLTLGIQELATGAAMVSASQTSMIWWDAPAAGTYTYQLQAWVNVGTSSAAVYYSKFRVVELF